MKFTPTAKNDHDSHLSRTLAAINVARTLHGIFNNSSLDIVPSLQGDIFGVVDWDSHNQVGGDVVTLAREELKTWGYDTDVVALPGAKGAQSVHLNSHDEFVMKFRLGN